MLKLPLSQDLVARRPVVVEGGALDSVAALRPLTVVEKQSLGKLKAAARAAKSAGGRPGSREVDRRAA